MFPYPLSYFSSIIKPQKMFANRHTMTLWQRLFTTVFLIALLVIPSSLQTMQLHTYPLDTFIDGIYAPLTEEIAADLAEHHQFSDGELTYTGTARYQAVTFGKEVPQGSGFTYQFDTDKLIIRKDTTTLVDISYQMFESSSFADRQSLTTAISQAWYQQNRLPITLSITLISTFLLGTNLLFIVLGATFFLYLTKKSKLFHLQSVKECYNLSLNCLGLPTILACFVGLFGHTVTTVMSVQNILFVLVLLWVFFTTKFRDRA
ncbi:hypothetical protein BVE84_07305 [Streptococcus azizii]|uniref:Maltodextrose utilization protein MalA n=1 Tax=Streptococcus azizii TaxID=1579424 RepID=A0AB36JPK9_9STRE|nr:MULTISPECIES: DUF1189 family protein [Streptococcus]MBF0776329.1 DUF1189 family protein [Streptococcus sp. 19428wD3_AN2]ONK26640.1 hypothetical protein BVE86_07125 [Streptococcus azizii]ONK27131.1 hypothetical protein BVE85_06825 [Streptococcus azizii]ONK28045.1 hypothetical protein BVE84_07305 [Streptococcus azizii]TFU83267.1 DUF1189 domain-containing protein [Streptococcus sp. AN2]